MRLRGNDTPLQISPLFFIVPDSSLSLFPFESAFLLPPFLRRSLPLPSSGKRGKRSELRGRVRLTASRRVTVRGGREEEAGKRRAR